MEVVETARREAVYEHDWSYDTRPIPILQKEQILEKPVQRSRPPAKKKPAKRTMRQVKRQSMKRRQLKSRVHVVTIKKGDWVSTKTFTQKCTPANTSMAPVPFVRGRYRAIRRKKTQPKVEENTMIALHATSIVEKKVPQHDVTPSKSKRSLRHRLLSKLPGRAAKYEVSSSPLPPPFVRNRFQPIRRPSQKKTATCSVV